MAIMFEELLADIDRERQRVADKTSIDAKKEIAANVYPLLREIVEQIGNRLGETEEALVSYFQSEENTIQPELGAQILGVFDATRQMCLVLLAGKEYEALHEGARQLAAAVDDVYDTVDSSILEEDEEDDEEGDVDEEDEEVQ